jgi:hypothetical protein
MEAKRYTEALTAMEQSQQLAQSLVSSGQLLEEASSDLQITTSGVQEIRKLLEKQDSSENLPEDV